MIRKAVIFAASAFLAACSSTAVTQPRESAFAGDPRLGERVDRVCFSSTIDNFMDATDRTIVIERGVNDKYLIETVGRCPDLEWAQSIAISASGTCLTRFDELFASESAFGVRGALGRPVKRCVIGSIHTWHPERAEPPTGEQTPPS